MHVGRSRKSCSK